ncbi:MAG: hypothetical protein QW348_02600 [Ignisphaera sp.]
MDIAIISAYLLAMILIGVYAAKRVSSASDLYVGGLNFGGVATALSFFTTYFSSVIFVGATAIGWKYGLLVLWKDVFVVFVGTLAAFIFIGPRLLAFSRRFGFSSIVEFIEVRYKSSLAGVIAALTTFVGLYIYTISALIGMARALEAMGLDYTMSLLISSVTTLLYIALGGYLAQVWTQSIQAVFMLAMAIAIAVTSLASVGGIGNLQQRLSSIDPLLASWPYRDLLPMFSFYLSLGFMGIGNPALVMKFITARDRISLKLATVVATATVATLTLSLDIASATTRAIISSDSVKPDHAFIYLTKTLMPKGFDTLMIIAILSASMSTISALINTLTHTLRDVVKKLGNNLIGNTKRDAMFFRITTATLAATATILALKPPEMLITLFGVTTAILSSTLVGPIIYGLYWRKATAEGAIASMVTSFAIAIAVSAYGHFSFPWTYYAFVPALAASLMVMPITNLVSKPARKQNC